jgi:DNA-binding NtrC family response regulator
MAQALRRSARVEPTQAGPLRVTLRGGTLEEPKSRVVITIDDAPVRVGRGESCDLRLEDRLVSTVHCELVPTDLGVLVRDLGSKNGTWIGDVVLGPDQYGYMRRATTLVVGDTRLSFTPGPPTHRELARRLGQLESLAPLMQRVVDTVQKVAAIDVAVHITGESGTGKGYVARAIHDNSERASKPFVVIDCSAIQPSLAEAELFGYEKGAFTGSIKRKESPFVDAEGGTVFLDEVGDLPVEVQAKLLRVVDEQEVKSVGQNRYRKVNVRIVSATLHNLSDRVNKALFREDLYNRLCATQVTLPPLRARREDIEPLTKQILTDLGRPDAFDTIAPATLDWMKKRDWEKGNVRQLRQVLKLAVDLARGGRIDIEAALHMNTGGDLAVPATDETRSELLYNALTVRGTSHKAVTDEASRVLFERLVRETGGNLVHMCRRAEVSRPFLRDHLQQLGLRDIPLPHGGPSTKAKGRGASKLTRG